MLDRGAHQLYQFLAVAGGAILSPFVIQAFHRALHAVLRPGGAGRFRLSILKSLMFGFHRPDLLLPRPQPAGVHAERVCRRRSPARSRRARSRCSINAYSLPGVRRSSSAGQGGGVSALALRYDQAGRHAGFVPVPGGATQRLRLPDSEAKTRFVGAVLTTRVGRARSSSSSASRFGASSARNAHACTTASGSSPGRWA